MKPFRTLAVALSCLSGTLSISGAASAVQLKVCQIKATKGQRPISPENVQKFVMKLEPAIVADTSTDDRRSFEFEDATGCMVAEVPATWTQLRIVYTFDEGKTFAEFPSATGRAFRIVEEPMRKKGDLLWVHGGLQARGEPIAAMLYLLTQEAATLKERAQAALRASALNTAVYLDLQAAAADLRANLDLELTDAADRGKVLASNAEKTKAVEALLGELIVTDGSLLERHRNAQAAAETAQKTLAGFHALVDKGVKAAEALDKLSADISQKYASAQVKEVSRRVTDLINTIPARE